ncbi:hypothetical protein ES708_11528 [subsurface metagenome]
MNLPKAIELNKEAEKSLRDHKFIDHADAVKLGGEALEFRQRWEQQEGEADFLLLPGETKD